MIFLTALRAGALACCLASALASPLSLAGGYAKTEKDYRHAQDDYYSSDLDAAIDEARTRTHHYDYSHALRYERTTSQSIQFPRMRNAELEHHRIETASLAGDASGDIDAEGQGISAELMSGAVEADDLTNDTQTRPAVAVPTLQSGNAIPKLGTGPGVNPGINVSINPR
ncbi:MAG: hypothetical protein VXZ05_07515 [Pseudomonadota bacterium]|nr:hypothetical protein [Pseudomonadota bacterium]